MAAEKRFRELLVNALRPDVFVEYISSEARVGLPDLHMIWAPHGASVWAELKVADTNGPQKPDARISDYGFTRAQVAYLKRVSRAGGIGLGLVGLNEKRRWYTVMLLDDELGDGQLTWRQLEGRKRILVQPGMYDELQEEYTRLIRKPF